MKSEIYIDRLMEMMGKLKEQSLPLINEAARKIVDTVNGGRRVYIFGCTHAGILTQEAFYRTGGLAIFNPIFAPGMTVDATPITITSMIERLDGYGAVIASQTDLNEGDLLFIHSTSGRNNVPIDLALAARSKGVYVIGITSFQYSRVVLSRHDSGKRLFEICDMVIDNLCPYGDSLVELENSGIFVAPGSTVLGVTILNAIVAQAAALFDESNQLPPVFISANTDAGDQYNRSVFERYRAQIDYKMK
jgi:uncharacterized phosphosugar-binding protein